MQRVLFENGRGRNIIFLTFLLALAACAGPRAQLKATDGWAPVRQVSSFNEKLAPNEIELTSIDVGQGDGYILRSGAGDVIVIDSGTRKGGRTLLKHLRANNIRAIDLLVLTHPHADHIGGGRDLVNAMPIKKVWVSGFPGTTRTHKNTMKAFNEHKIPVEVIRKGAVLTVQPGLEITVFAPETPLLSRSRSPANANSIVMWIRHGLVDFLFTGDAERETESRVLRVMSANGPKRFEVLKVAHHGSRYATSRAFLSRVKPALGLISCGRKNRYGHPHPDVLNRLSDFGVRVLRTDQMGTFQIRSDGTSIMIPTSGLDKPSSRPHRVSMENTGIRPHPWTVLPKNSKAPRWAQLYLNDEQDRLHLPIRSAPHQ